MKEQVDLVVSCPKWGKAAYINSDLIKKVFASVLDQFENFKLFNSIKIVVLLTNNNYMRRLNSTYRHKNKPTNVLSFAELKMDYKKIHLFNHQNDDLSLGSIALGYDITQKEANQLSITFIDHFCHLLVHGILHLLGFDHEKDEDAAVMEHLEKKILSNLN